jgi:hypothetical protein
MLTTCSTALPQRVKLGEHTRDYIPEVVGHSPDDKHFWLRHFRDAFVSPSVGSRDALADSLRRELAAQGAIVPSVKVRRVPAIPRTGACKAPLIKAGVT